MGTSVADTPHASSFGFLAPYGPLYLRLATVAERALAVDPSLTLVSLRQLAEAFAKHAAARAGLTGGRDAPTPRPVPVRGCQRHAGC